MVTLRPTLAQFILTQPQNSADPALLFLSEEGIPPPAIGVFKGRSEFSLVEVYTSLRHPAFPERARSWDWPALPAEMKYDMFTAVSHLYGWAIRIMDLYKQQGRLFQPNEDVVVYFPKWGPSFNTSLLPIIDPLDPCSPHPEK